MPGFMSKLQGYHYEGEYVAASEMKNGIFCYINNGKMTKTNSEKDVELVVREKTDIGDDFGLRCFVKKAEGDVVYFVENGADINTSLSYDIFNNIIKQGEEVRAHRLIQGDDVIFSVDSETYSGVNVGDILKPGADGKVSPISKSSKLLNVTISNLSLPFSFDKDVTEYDSIATFEHDAEISYQKEDDESTVVVKLDGAKQTSSTITFNGEEGQTKENVLTFEVTNGDSSTTYTFTITVDWL